MWRRSYRDPFAFKWPFYILTLVFHRVPSHPTNYSKVLPTQVHSSLFILGWIKSLSNASDLSSSWDFNQLWHLFSRKWLDSEFQFHNQFWLEGWQCRFADTTRHFQSRLKYLNNYWMDGHEILYRHPQSQENGAYSLWWLMSLWGLAVLAFLFFFFWVNVSTTVGWIVMKCGSDIHGSLKINLNDFGVFWFVRCFGQWWCNDGGYYMDWTTVHLDSTDI